MESNGTKNDIDDPTSKNVTKSEEFSVSPDLTAHDFNLEFLKHLDDLKSDEVKKNNDSEKIVQEVFSDADLLVQVQNAFSLRMKIKNNSLMTKHPSIKNENHPDFIEDKFDSNFENVSAQSEEFSASTEETAHDFNIEFLKHLDNLEAEEVKNEETEITSEVLSDAEKLVQVQNAFRLRMKIKNNSLMAKDPTIKNQENHLDFIKDKFDSNFENVSQSSEEFSVSTEETAHDFNLEFLKHLDNLKAEEVKNEEETEITSEVLSDAEKLSRVEQAFALRKQIKSDTSKSVSSKWWKSSMDS